MAMTQAPATVLADTVRNDLQTPSTTSQTTLNLLRALLGLDLADAKDAVAVPPAPKKAHKSPAEQPARLAAHKPSAARTKAKSNFKIHDAASKPLQPLPLDRRRALATETFNITLKHLSSKAKEKQNVGQVQSAGTPRTSPQKALQSRSQNCATFVGSKEKAINTIKTTNTVLDQEFPLQTTADCAIAALQCLANQEDDKTVSAADTDTSLIRGAQILLDKLIGLGLTAQASQQIWQVRKLLHSHSGGYTKQVTMNPSLSSALSFDRLPIQASLLNLTSTFQLQVLKVGSLLGITFIDQELVQLLDVSNSSGPVAVCSKAIESGAMTKDKAGQYLYGFSAILSRSCSAIRGNKRCSLTSLDRFRLTAAMLSIRCHSWKWIGHKPDLEKELWTPLSRALQDYSETSDTTKSKELSLVKDSIATLQELLGTLDHVKLLPASVANLLVEIAQRCGCAEDALELLNKGISNSETSSGLAVVINHCRAATISLGDTAFSAQVRLSSGERALDSLKSPLKGTASELRELLLHGARLRKAALTTALTVEKLQPLAQKDDIVLQTCSIRLLYAINRFVLRYVGQNKAHDKIPTNRQLPAEMRTAVCNSARNTVESVLSIMKCKNVRSALLRDETEAALEECLEMTSTVGESANIESDKSSDHRTQQAAYLKISNIYWAWYLHEKEINVDTTYLCRLLERSVDALKLCTDDEKTLGFEIVKCERVASCYQTLGEVQRARLALLQAIRASISQGVLSEAVEIVLTKPSRLAWTNPKLNAHILGSCLRKLARASANHESLMDPGEVSYFDDETLPNIHRAQILELQLFAVAELQTTDSLKANCSSLTKQILDLCQQPQHHVYRIRFIRDVLNLAARHAQFPIHDVLDDELIQTVCTFQQTSSISGGFLTSYGPLLCLSVLLQWAFLSTRPSAECLRGLVDNTASLLSQCQSKSELEVTVDDPESLLRHLSAAADYAGMLDLVDVKLNALKAMQQLLTHHAGADTTRLASCLVNIGKTTARLGNTSIASRSFAEAEKLLSRAAEHAETRLSWCLAYSDYLVDLEAYEKCSEMVGSAYSSYAELVMQSKTQPRGSHRLKQDSYLSHAALVVSNLAFRQGDLRSAIRYARQCVRLTTGLWAALEKLFEGVKDHLEMTGIDLTQAHAEETLNTTFSFDHSNLHTVVQGAPFWAHIHLHFRALLHISTLSAHCGLYPDAVYYAGLASKLSSVITSEQRQTVCRVKLALLYANGSQISDASSLIKAIRLSSLNLLPDLDAIGLSLDLATAALVLNDTRTSERHLERAGLSMSKLLLHVPPPVTAGASTVATIEKEMRTVRVNESKSSRGASVKPKTVPVQKGRPRKPVTSLQAPLSAPTNRFLPPVVVQLQESQATLLLQIQLRKGEVSSKSNLSDQALTPVQPSASASKKLVDATVLLNQALAMFSSDAVHCVLAETALAYPSRSSARRPSARVSALSATTFSAKAKAASARPKQKQNQGDNDTISDSSSPQRLLRNAYELLSSACSVGIDRSSSDTVHDVQKLFCRLSMLANAVGLSLNYSPATVVNDSLKPKDTMILRESFVLDTDLPDMDKSEIRKWPEVPRCPGIVMGENTAEQIQAPTCTFDDLPETWSVISVSLNDVKTEMLVSRIRAGTTPLILRIPLARSAIDDAEENEFTYHEAKEELVDIVSNANLTAHDSRSQADKAARKTWWAEREALDRRLETLLLNMENIWLGGFRGILSQQHQSDEEMLSKLSNALDSALEKHLPSRQKTGGTSKQRVRLHAHILDLFVALGDPNENELDDAVTDLLYFVVDILQFEGERNAYDEIDFDAILVDVLDALRSYHESCLIDNKARHTILILDKELHAFPWESMPCLLGKSVSRMPSMGMIHDRLATIRAQSPGSAAYSISASSGGYILNPSSDLPSTETTFAKTFTQQLSSFTSIVSCKPSESEFEAFLHDNSLFLYFGHGSGAQYIRGRRIKQLDKCAVTFLMGCSSGKMTECGVYESHGVPWNYMHAGSMAVVGTLWDVTDRDIDRFAVTAFEEWGLLEGVQEDEKTRKKTEARKRKDGGRKVKKIDERKGKGQVMLDEAVNRARNACILRYLNGAAVVMYGLPVMLE